MNTVRVELQKLDVERTLISVGMMLMECIGFVMLVCGILGVKLF